MKLGIPRKLLCQGRTKQFLEECVAPFLAGFILVSAFFWAQENLRTKGHHTTPPPNSPLRTAVFRDENGLVFLKRHGLQSESDIHKVSSKSNLFSIQADASNDFKKVHVPASTVTHFDGTGAPADPPGTIWPWLKTERESNPLPRVWVVTPTYRNPYQYAELTRMAQALYPARRFVHWLIVDDYTKSSKHKTHLDKLQEFIAQFSVPFTIIRSRPRSKTQKVIFKPKGVDARRTAIHYIRKMKLKGVVYFADDDNTYDSDIFRQMQNTKTVSIWPTGAITQWTVSSPVVNKSGVVIDFFDAWVANRKFPVDFASIAVNCELIHQDRKVNIPWIQGYEETIFLSTLKVPPHDFQPLAANATEVLTWHTKTLQSRNQEMIDVLMQDLENWPVTAQELVKKYDFMFDRFAWTSKSATAVHDSSNNNNETMAKGSS